MRISLRTFTEGNQEKGTLQISCRHLQFLLYLIEHFYTKIWINKYIMNIWENLQIIYISKTTFLLCFLANILKT